MLYWIRQSLRRQLAFLLAVLVIAAAALSFWHAAPLLRFSFRTVSLGAIAGLFGALILLSGTALGLLFPRTGARDTLLADRRDLKQASPATRISSIISAAAGEEYLLRGLAFGALADANYAAALCLTAALTGAGYYRGRRHWYSTLLRIVEACWYAVVFDQRRSLALVVAARLVALALANLALRSEFAGRVLEESRLSWRKLYGYALSGFKKAPHRILRRV